MTVGTVPSDASTFTDASVASGTPYAWRVVAAGDDGTAGTQSPVATATP